MSADENRLTPYHWRLLIFLGVASFFEGYDHFALSQILPEFRADMGIDGEQAGYMVAVIMVGTIIAFLLVRYADRVGRKPVLTWTIAGYTVFSLLSGLAPNVWVFTFCQFFARIFLIGEWAISMVYAAEEFPADKRGLMIGLVNAFAAFGSVACAGIVPLLLDTPWGWRTVYFVGTIPLILLAYARRDLRETKRFLEMGPSEPTSLFTIFSTPYRFRVLQLAAIWAATYFCTQTAVFYWKEHALDPRGPLGWTDQDVALVIMIGALVAMPLTFGVGYLFDRIGRKAGAVVIYASAVASVFAVYSLQSWILIVVAMIGAIFGAAAVLPVLNAFTTELFPTELRSQAFAWSNNLLGRIGYIAGPAVVGYLQGSIGYGPAVMGTSVGAVAALLMILFWLPETRGQELEESSALS